MPKYLTEMVLYVPSALMSASALLMAACSSGLFLRIRTPELLNSAVLSVAAIFTRALGFCFLKSRKVRLSLSVASARPLRTS